MYKMRYSSHQDSAVIHGWFADGVRTGIAMHCGCRIFKMAAKVEKFRKLYALIIIIIIFIEDINFTDK